MCKSKGNAEHSRKLPWLKVRWNPLCILLTPVMYLSKLHIIPGSKGVSPFVEWPHPQYGLSQLGNHMSTAVVDANLMILHWIPSEWCTPMERQQNSRNGSEKFHTFRYIQISGKVLLNSNINRAVPLLNTNITRLKYSYSPSWSQINTNFVSFDLYESCIFHVTITRYVPFPHFCDIWGSTKVFQHVCLTQATIQPAMLLITIPDKLSDFTRCPIGLMHFHFH